MGEVNPCEWVDYSSHYQPIHLSTMGKNTGRFIGGNNTENIALRIIRLPLNNLTTEAEVIEVCEQIKAFYNI